MKYVQRQQEFVLFVKKDTIYPTESVSLVHQVHTHYEEHLQPALHVHLIVFPVLHQLDHVLNVQLDTEHTMVDVSYVLDLLIQQDLRLIVRLAQDVKHVIQQQDNVRHVNQDILLIHQQRNVHLVHQDLIHQVELSLLVLL